MSDEAKRLPVGYTIRDRFRVEGSPQSGGFGSVYRAQDSILGRPVAIKVLHRITEELRFQREARLLGNIQHENVVTVFDFGVTDFGPYIVQEWLDGKDLSELVRDGSLGTTAKLEILLQLARALTAAHEGGLLHRDVKPQNVRLLPTGRVKLLDFGLARPAKDLEFMTGTGIAFGTPGYSAPEQLLGAQIDQRADIYSFGAVAYELLSGQRVARPGQREQGVEIAAPLPGDPKVSTLILTCLSLDPVRRPGSGPELLRELEAIAVHRPEPRREPTSASTIPFGTPGVARSPLQAQAEEYLGRVGFRVEHSVPGYSLVRRLDEFGDHERRAVWTLPRLTRKNVSLELQIEPQLRAIAEQFPSARRIILFEDLSFYSADFLAAINQAGATRRVPAQFFDAAFKAESELTFEQLVQRVAGGTLGKARVPQPYSRTWPAATPAAHADLLYELRSALGPRGSGGLHIVLGPAGAGKTVLFRELVASLLEEHNAQKARLRPFPRPVPFSPSELQGRADWTLDGLIASGIGKHLAARMNSDAFRWLLQNGYSTWIFDGLEEVYSGDPAFFAELLELLAENPGHGNVVVFSRSSILADPQTAALLAPGEPNVLRYELAPWPDQLRRTYAEIRTGQKHQADAFIQELGRRVPGNLSGLPFYLQLLVDEFMATGRLASCENETAPVARFVEGFLHRELEMKPEIPLNRHHFQEPGSLMHWLTDVAIQSYSSGPFVGVEDEVALAEAELYVREDLGRQEREGVLRALLRLPLFERTPGASRLRFRFDLVEEYLASERISTDLSKSPTLAQRALRHLPRTLHASSLAVPRLRRLVAEDTNAWTNLRIALASGSLSTEALRKGVELALSARTGSGTFKELRVGVAGLDLTGIKFTRQDLSGVSFENSNLTGAWFDACTLREARFAGAVLDRTHFDKLQSDGLHGADLGDLSRAESIVVDGKLLRRGQEMATWLAMATGQRVELTDDCPAAMQLREVLLKFFNAKGGLIRQQHLARTLLRGRQIPDGPTVQATVRALQGLGVLSPNDYRDRIGYVRTSAHDALVSFLAERKLLEPVRGVVEVLCGVARCPHMGTSDPS